MGNPRYTKLIIETKQYVIKRQKEKCFWCGQSMIMTPQRNLPKGTPKAIRKRVFTVEHIIPLSCGGKKYNMNNVVGACQGCNSARGNKMPEFKELFNGFNRMFTV